jgi:hypothetical protein
MKMRTAIALLVEDELSNGLASFTLRCRDYGFSLNVLRLPAHVSLKQPFVVNDFERFEKYFEEFARHTEPHPLQLDGFELWGMKNMGLSLYAWHAALVYASCMPRSTPSWEHSGLIYCPSWRIILLPRNWMKSQFHRDWQCLFTKSLLGLIRYMVCGNMALTKSFRWDRRIVTGELT